MSKDKEERDGKGSCRWSAHASVLFGSSCSIARVTTPDVDRWYLAAGPASLHLCTPEYCVWAYFAVAVVVSGGDSLSIVDKAMVEPDGSTRQLEVRPSGELSGAEHLTGYGAVGTL